MKKLSERLGVLILTGSLLLSGCAAGTVPRGPVEPTQGTTVGVPDPASGTSLPVDDEASKAMQKERSIDGIVSITLKDLDGKPLDRTFTAEETAAIQQAFNESFIMDTAYIEMLAGSTMSIALKDGREVFITSYGDENYIVARIGEGPSYHLGCPLIGKILLEETK